MQQIKLAEGVYHVGVKDWNISDFHGYSTPYGSTYNAFLIVDKKIALIDTVKKEFTDELMANIASIVDPKKIDFVVSNHTEMDHSGALASVMHRIGKDKPVYCSKMGFKNLAMHHGANLNLVAVENGGEISCGKKTLTFLETRMIHWPDSMFTYLKEDGILFSSDGFGQHFASHEVFDDNVEHGIMSHAQKYFANILLLYSAKIGKLIEGVKNMNLDIKMICPDHGVCWRKDPGKIIDAYINWCEQIPKKEAVVIYDTMWHSTETMAKQIAAGIHDAGVHVRPLSLKKWHRSDVMTQVMDAAAVVVGSPTLNNQMFPTVSDMLTYMKGLKPKNKIGAAFGSYGWSGESARLITEELTAMKFDLVEPGLRVQYVPDEEAKKACYDFGMKIGQAVVEKVA